MFSQRNRRIVIIFCLLFSIVLGSEQSRNQESTCIAIVHPHLSSLRSFLAMQQDSIIDIPKLTFLAVYYQPAQYPVETIRANLDEAQSTKVEFLTVTGNLNPENLYQTNACSDDFQSIFERTDGVLFLGGADFPPSLYGEKTNLLTNIHTPERHHFELSFLFHLLGGFQNEEYRPLITDRPEYVVNGFCLGLQTINVATGGTMIQDIPSELYDIRYIEDLLHLNPDQQHDNYWENLNPRKSLSWCSFHRIQLTKGSFLMAANMLAQNETPHVCSSHHQAIEKLGKDLVVAATSMDGKVIEAIIHRSFPNVYGFQFHPEPYRLYDPDASRFQVSPQDSIHLNYYEMLQQKNSLEFHFKLWHYFTILFRN